MLTYTPDSSFIHSVTSESVAGLRRRFPPSGGRPTRSGSSTGDRYKLRSSNPLTTHTRYLHGSRHRVSGPLSRGLLVFFFHPLALLFSITFSARPRLSHLANELILFLWLIDKLSFVGDSGCESTETGDVYVRTRLVVSPLLSVGLTAVYDLRLYLPLRSFPSCGGTILVVDG